MAQNPNQQQQRVAIDLPDWELDRLSPTGRHFLLEPESRTEIVQELEVRLMQEQRRRREQLLRSGNNASQSPPSDTLLLTDREATAPAEAVTLGSTVAAVTAPAVNADRGPGPVPGAGPAVASQTLRRSSVQSIHSTVADAKAFVVQPTAVVVQPAQPQRSALASAVNTSTPTLPPPPLPVSPQGEPPQPTMPCLTCLMRCLNISGLVSSCWTAAFLELEEAFAIKKVADASVGKIGSPDNDSGEEVTNHLPPASSSGENFALKSPELGTSKWQALERLCILRNSLRSCSHDPNY